MNTIARIIYELLCIWEQFKADRKRLKRDELIKKSRKNPTGAFNDHFGGLHGDEKSINKASKTKD